MREKRYKKAGASAWLIVISLMVVTLGSATAGWLTGSLSLFADSAYSALGFASMIVAMVLRKVKTSVENSRTMRLEKLYAISAVLFASLYCFSGIELIYHSLQGIQYDAPLSLGGTTVLAAGLLLFIKLLVKFNLRQLNGESQERGNEQGVPLGVSTSLIAFIGLGCAYTSEQAYLSYDRLAAAIIGVVMLSAGYRYVSNFIASKDLSSIRDEDSTELVSLVQRMPGVIAVNELGAKEQGHYVVIDMKISVNPKITVMEGQEIAKSIRHQLLKRYSHLTEVVIQVFPYDAGYPYKSDDEISHNDAHTMLH